MTAEDAGDAFYEWLMSDAPAAAEERARRCSGAADAERAEQAQVAAIIDRLLGDPATSMKLRSLAQTMRSVLDRGVTRTEAEAALSDAEWVARERRAYAIARRVAGDFDYRYPDRYVGAAATRQSVPDEPVAPSVLLPRVRARSGPGEPAWTVAHVTTDQSACVVGTTDGRRLRLPTTSVAYRIHDPFRVTAPRDITPPAHRDVPDAGPELER